MDDVQGKSLALKFTKNNKRRKKRQSFMVNVSFKVF